MTLVPGTTLGRYQILSQLGQGGMAIVYKAYQPSLDRTVALKVVRQGFAEDQDFMARFEREAKAVARLLHPHIVQVHDYDQQAGSAFLVMEYVEGGTLKERIAELARDGQRLPPREVARIVSEVAEALSYAHSLGIVHRDIKSSNVMLTRDGRAVVTDFGIARMLAAQQQTVTGVGLGTPEYMSPEQGQGQPVDARSDIYSLGVLAYELLVGRLPYSADTPFAVVMAHVRDPLPLPSKVNPQVGPQTERALLRALAKVPAERFAEATAFAAALAGAIAADGGRVTAATRVPAAGPVLQRPTFAAGARLATIPRPALIGGIAILLIAAITGTATVSGALRSAGPAGGESATRTPASSATRTPSLLGSVPSVTSAIATLAAGATATPRPSAGAITSGRVDGTWAVTLALLTNTTTSGTHSFQFTPSCASGPCSLKVVHGFGTADACAKLPCPVVERTLEGQAAFDGTTYRGLDTTPLLSPCWRADGTLIGADVYDNTFSYEFNVVDAVQLADGTLRAQELRGTLTRTSTRVPTAPVNCVAQQQFVWTLNSTR